MGVIFKVPGVIFKVPGVISKVPGVIFKVPGVIFKVLGVISKVPAVTFKGHKGALKYSTLLYITGEQYIFENIDLYFWNQCKKCYKLNQKVFFTAGAL